MKYMTSACAFQSIGSVDHHSVCVSFLRVIFQKILNHRQEPQSDLTQNNPDLLKPASNGQNSVES